MTAVPGTFATTSWGSNHDPAINLPSGIAAGDFLLMAVSVNSTGVTISVDGWDPVTDDLHADYASFRLLSRTADGTEGATAAGHLNGWVSGTSVVGRFTSCAGIDVEAHAGPGNGTAPTCPPMVTTVADTLIVRIVGYNVSGTPAVPSGHTQRAVATGGTATETQTVLATQDAPVASPTLVSGASYANGAYTGYVAWSVALKPGAGGGPSGEVVDLGGTSAATSSSSARLAATRRMGAVAASASSGSARLSAVRGMAASSAATSSAQARLGRLRSLAASSGALSTTDAVLAVLRRLAGSSTTSSTATARLAAARSMGGLSAAVSDAEAQLAVARTLAAISDAVSGGAAVLVVDAQRFVDLGGLSVATSGAYAALVRTVSLAGTSDATSAGTARLAAVRRLAASSRSTSTAAAVLTVKPLVLVDLGGRSGATSTSEARLSVARNMAAVSDAMSDAQATVARTVRLSGRSAVTSHAEARLARLVTLGGRSDATSSAWAALLNGREVAIVGTILASFAATDILADVLDAALEARFAGRSIIVLEVP